MAQNQKLRDQTQDNSKYLIALNKKLDQVVVHLAQHGETLAAIVSVLGENTIETKINELRNSRRQNRELELEKIVQTTVDKGLIQLAPDSAVIDENSFIVGDEISQDGSSSRVQYELKSLDADGQSRYLGKKVGDEITKQGFPTKIVVRQIFVINHTKIQELVNEQKANLAATA